MNFKEYLDRRNEKPKHFAIRAKLSENTIYKLYKGEQLRIDTAKRIVRVTHGEVTLADLGYENHKANRKNL